MANLQTDRWKKEAETLRSRLEGIESRLVPSPGAAQSGGGGSPGRARTPLRESVGSGSQGRLSAENRQVNTFWGQYFRRREMSVRESSC